MASWPTSWTPSTWPTTCEPTGSGRSSRRAPLRTSSSLLRDHLWGTLSPDQRKGQHTGQRGLACMRKGPALGALGGPHCRACKQGKRTLLGNIVTHFATCACRYLSPFAPLHANDRLSCPLPSRTVLRGLQKSWQIPPSSSRLYLRLKIRRHFLPPSWLGSRKTTCSAQHRRVSGRKGRLPLSTEGVV